MIKYIEFHDSNLNIMKKYNELVIELFYKCNVLLPFIIPELEKAGNFIKKFNDMRKIVEEKFNQKIENNINFIKILNDIIDILNDDEQNKKIEHYIKFSYGTEDDCNEFNGAWCSCGKRFKIESEAYIHYREANNQLKIYKGFDSIMEALLEGKKLKPKNKALYHSIIKFIDGNLNYIPLIVNFIFIDSKKSICVNITDIDIERNFSEIIETTYEFPFFDIYNGLEFEEYQEKELTKEYTISELEQKVGHKIKIIAEGDK